MTYSQSYPTRISLKWACLHIFVILSLVLLVDWLVSPLYFYQSVLIAILPWVGWVLGVRLVLTRHHRHGLKLAKLGEYEKAAQEFLKSYELFQKYPWLDQYRELTLGTDSQKEYREQALLNRGQCFEEMRDGQRARVCYLKAVDQYPESEVAKTSLQNLQADA